MSVVVEERPSDSPYIESVTRGRTLNDDRVIRPAESHWHLVVVRQHGRTRAVTVGPLTTAGFVSWTADAELLWIRFALGAYMPHLPAGRVLDCEMTAPLASPNSFWLAGATWEFPNFENVETFVDRLVRSDMLAHDQVVDATLREEAPDKAARTLRHRFQRATGLSQTYIRQMQRAMLARTMLERGVSIPDTMFDCGYFDQPHLTRSLKRFTGYTPAQILRMRVAQ